MLLAKSLHSELIAMVFALLDLNSHATATLRIYPVELLVRREALTGRLLQTHELLNLSHSFLEHFAASKIYTILNDHSHYKI